jgi:hypothetical protein
VIQDFGCVVADTEVIHFSVLVAISDKCHRLCWGTVSSVWSVVEFTRLPVDEAPNSYS